MKYTIAGPWLAVLLLCGTNIMARLEIINQQALIVRLEHTAHDSIEGWKAALTEGDKSLKLAQDLAERNYQVTAKCYGVAALKETR